MDLALNIEVLLQEAIEVRRGDLGTKLWRGAKDIWESVIFLFLWAGRD